MELALHHLEEQSTRTRRIKCLSNQLRSVHRLPPRSRCAPHRHSPPDDNDNTEGFYLGAAIGDFSADLDRPDDVDDVDLDFDNQDANRIFAGWRFNRFAAFQLDWTDFGDRTPRRALSASRPRATALTPSIVGTLPLGPVELYAKAGMMFYNVEVNNNTSNLVDDSGNDPVYGVGIGFTALSGSTSALEYERIDIEQFDDANAVWLSANWRF